MNRGFLDFTDYRSSGAEHINSTRTPWAWVCCLLWKPSWTLVAQPSRHAPLIDASLTTSWRSSVPSLDPALFSFVVNKYSVFSFHKCKLHWEGNLLSLSCGGLSVWHSPWQVIRAINFDYLSAPWSCCWLEKTLKVCDTQSDELRYFSAEHLRGQRAVGSENDDLAETMVS